MSKKTDIENMINMLGVKPLHKAVKYLSEKEVVRVTRRHKHDKRNKRNEFVVTIGEPNYLERKFIKKLNKANVLFPLRKIQVYSYPKKRK